MALPFSLHLELNGWRNFFLTKKNFKQTKTLMNTCLSLPFFLTFQFTRETCILIHFFCNVGSRSFSWRWPTYKSWRPPSWRKWRKGPRMLRRRGRNWSRRKGINMRGSIASLFYFSIDWYLIFIIAIFFSIKILKQVGPIHFIPFFNFVLFANWGGGRVIPLSATKIVKLVNLVHFGKSGRKKRKKSHRTGKRSFW